MDRQVMGKYRKRVLKGAILKSILAGLSIGCITAAVTELCSWFFGFKAGIYLAIGLFVAVSVVASIIFYIKRYKPTAKTVASKIDALGFEERVLTMVEYEGDDSYIATVQREDTKNALSKVNHTLIKYAVTAAMIVSICVSAFVFANLTTVNALYTCDVIPSGMELLQRSAGVNEYSVKYSATLGGRLIYLPDDWSDEEVQVEDAIIVKEGDDIPMIIAVADPGFTFVGWSDNSSRRPERRDTNVSCNIRATAKFQKVDAPLLPEDSYIQDSMSFHKNNGGTWDDRNEYVDPGDLPQNPPEDQENNFLYDGTDRTQMGNMTDDGQTYYGDSYPDDYKNAMQGEGDPSNEGLVDGYFNGLNPPGGTGSIGGDDGSGDGSGESEGGN